ncbi:MAG: aminotransferase class I/II-fold pyridoxal phosphate-dependent enzyme, partial [Thermomicrobiales bacterium]
MTGQPISRRTAALASTTAPLIRFIESNYARLADWPSVCNFAFGNPHDMPLPGLVEALQRWAVPQNKDWFAYKDNDPESQAIVAASLQTWRS